MLLRIGLVPAIVHDVEANPRRRHPEHDTEWQSLPSAGGKEHQRHIGERERAENDGGFQIHPRAVALATPHTLELGVDPSPQFVMERVVAAEFKRLVMDTGQFGHLVSAIG